MFLGSKVRPVRRTDNLTTICEPFCLDNVGSLISHNPIGLQGLLWGQLYIMETECASCEVRTGLEVLLQVASISQLTVRYCYCEPIV
jgi:hypothetical protein